jgi:antitoxin component YwqK of YwqJK toxin-antitoxin module
MDRVRWGNLSSKETEGKYLLAGEPFTGFVFDLHDNGQLEVEQEFRDGFASGAARNYFESGNLEEESHWRGGVYHGLRRTWHQNGQLASEELFEWGGVLSRKRWDETGELVEDYWLQESDPEFATQQLYRSLYGRLDDT